MAKLRWLKAPVQFISFLNLYLLLIYASLELYASVVI